MKNTKIATGNRSGFASQKIFNTSQVRANCQMKTFETEMQNYINEIQTTFAWAAYSNLL